MLRNLRALWRLFVFALGASFYLVRYFIKVPFIGFNLDRGIRLRQQFFRWLLPKIGVRVDETGTPPAQPGIYISNHRSYFDPIPVLAQINALPVAKAEVIKWPLIGLGLRASGVFFVDRNDDASRKKTRKAIGEIFKKGYGILIYPEGTTHIQERTIEFKYGAFKEAIAVGAPVYPIAIAYQNIEDAWIGSDTFFRHFFERFGFPSLQIKISYGPKLFSENAVELRKQAKTWIDQELDKLQTNWSTFARETGTSNVEGI